MAWNMATTPAWSSSCGVNPLVSAACAERPTTSLPQVSSQSLSPPPPPPISSLPPFPPLSPLPLQPVQQPAQHYSGDLRGQPHRDLSSVSVQQHGARGTSSRPVLQQPAQNHPLTPQGHVVQSLTTPTPMQNLAQQHAPRFRITIPTQWTDQNYLGVNTKRCRNSSCRNLQHVWGLPLSLATHARATPHNLQQIIAVAIFQALRRLRGILGLGLQLPRQQFCDGTRQLQKVVHACQFCCYIGLFVSCH